MRYIIGLLLIFLSITIHAQELLPKSGGEIVKHTYYNISYDEANEQAKWVYYELTPSMISGEVKRTDDFRADPMVTTKSAELRDYKGSGYDRGHLCPAAAMKINRQAMSETFYLSNMSPQVPGFNRGRWKTLEEQVRVWTDRVGELIVISGPVFKDNIGSIGANEVTVPGYYYKVIYSPNADEMIAFIMPNRKIIDPISDFVVTVDSVELLTEIDFFVGMEDAMEAELEGKVDVKYWEIGERNPDSDREEAGDSRMKQGGESKVNGAKSKAVKVQCKGIAKSTGKRCKIMTTNANGYCRYHQGQ